MLIKHIWLVTAMATLTGCTSWLNPHEQLVSVRTLQDGQAVQGLNCNLTNNMGQWQVITPGQVNVTTSSEDLVVTCASTDLQTGTSSAVARPWPGYLEHPVTGVVLPVGTLSTIDQQLNGVPQRYPRNIDVLLGEEFLITADQNNV